MFTNIQGTLSPHTALFQSFYGNAANVHVIYQTCNFSASEGNAPWGASVYQSQGGVALQHSALGSTFQNGLENSYATPVFEVIPGPDG